MKSKQTARSKARLQRRNAQAKSVAIRRYKHESRKSSFLDKALGERAEAAQLLKDAQRYERLSQEVQALLSKAAAVFPSPLPVDDN